MPIFNPLPLIRDSRDKYSGYILYFHSIFQFPGLEAEQRQLALMEKTSARSGFTLDPSQFLDVSQLLYLLSYKSQQKLARTLLALKHSNGQVCKSVAG